MYMFFLHLNFFHSKLESHFNVHSSQNHTEVAGCVRKQGPHSCLLFSASCNELCKRGQSVFQGWLSLFAFVALDQTFLIRSLDHWFWSLHQFHPISILDLQFFDLHQRAFWLRQLTIFFVDTCVHPQKPHLVIFSNLELAVLRLPQASWQLELGTMIEGGAARQLGWACYFNDFNQVGLWCLDLPVARIGRIPHPVTNKGK